MPRNHAFMWAVSLLCVGIYSILLPSRVEARDPALICDAAALRAAHTTGVPIEALRALAHTGASRSDPDDLRPWPWTVNTQGHPVWFETANQAQAHLFRHFQQGARSFEVGCFQINYRRHSTAFSSVEDMFDPDKNALCAARHLLRLHAELGGWDRAVAAYRSQTQSNARQLDRISGRRPNVPPQRIAEPSTHQSVNLGAAFSGQTLSQGNLRGSLVPLNNRKTGNIAARRGGS